MTQHFSRRDLLTKIGLGSLVMVPSLRVLAEEHTHGAPKDVVLDHLGHEFARLVNEGKTYGIGPEIFHTLAANTRLMVAYAGSTIDQGFATLDRAALMTGTPNRVQQAREAQKFGLDVSGWPIRDLSPTLRAEYAGQIITQGAARSWSELATHAERYAEDFEEVFQQQRRFISCQTAMVALNMSQMLMDSACAASIFAPEIFGPFCAIQVAGYWSFYWAMYWAC